MLGKLNPQTVGRKKNKKNRSKPITLICNECGKEYNVYNYQRDTRKFCSRECSSRNYNRTRTIYTLKEKECLYCGDKFTTKSYPRKPDIKYCCSDCANKHREILKKQRKEENEEMCNM